jgi:hypothetical protein
MAAGASAVGRSGKGKAVGLPRVVYGKLLNVFGRPAEQDGLKFLVAAVDLDGPSGAQEHRLREHPGFQAVTNIPNEYDVAFVRARIPRLFGFTPQKAQHEKSFLDEGFVCVFPEYECIPFLCCDHYGFTTLWFQDDVPDDQKARIATAFWSLMLSSTDDVEDFEDSADDWGGHKVTLGCRCGEVYAERESRC